MPKHSWCKTILLLSKLTIEPVWNPGTRCSLLSLRKLNTLHDTFLEFVGFLKKSQRDRSKKKKKKEKKRGSTCRIRRNNTAESTGVLKARHRMDKFGTAMRSRYALFRKTIQESLDAESSDGNHSWPGDATSSDSWQFCIARFSNCYGNEHHRMQNRAILLQCDRPLRHGASGADRIRHYYNREGTVKS